MKSNITQLQTIHQRFGKNCAVYFPKCKFTQHNFTYRMLIECRNLGDICKNFSNTMKPTINLLERQGGHHEVLDNIKIKHVSTTRYILSPRHQIRQHVSAIL